MPQRNRASGKVTTQKCSPRSRLLGAAVLASSVGLVLFTGQAQAVRVDYRADFAIERNDNLLLTPYNTFGTTIFRPGLGWLLSEQTSSWQAALAGRGEYLQYQDSRFDSGARGALSGVVNWTALPDRLDFTLENDLSLQPVNTLLPDTPANRQQINVLSVGPSLRFDVGRSMQGIAELRYINSRAEITEQFNSDRASGALRLVRDLSPTSTLSGNLQAQSVYYDSDNAGRLLLRDHDRTDAYLRYTKTLASLDLSLDAGGSRIAFKNAGDERSGELLRAQGTWRSGDRHQVTARASRQFSDTATDALTHINPSIAQPPGSISVGTSVVNASLYEERGMRLRYAYTGPRGTVVLAPYYNRLRYLDNDQLDQNARGARGELRWQARPRLTLGTQAAITKISYLERDRVDELREYSVHADYDWTRQVSSRLALTRRQRDLSIFDEDANQNLILLSLSYQNR